MNAKRKVIELTKSQIPHPGSIHADHPALHALLALTCSAPAITKDARSFAPLAPIFDEGVSSAAKIATVARLTDPEPLMVLAASDAPAYLRRDALLRLDELLDGTPLDQASAERLVPCLRHRGLIAYAVVLMDIADFDWCARCDERTVDALCLALHECQELNETILLEDTFAHLIHARPDLGHNLRACSPGKVHLQAMYKPLVVHNVVYVNMATEDNVA